jgi:hypothetical protein
MLLRSCGMIRGGGAPEQAVERSGSGELAGGLAGELAGGLLKVNQRSGPERRED